MTTPRVSIFFIPTLFFLSHETVNTAYYIYIFWYIIFLNIALIDHTPGMFEVSSLSGGHASDMIQEFASRIFRRGTFRRQKIRKIEPN